jgi:hypothetical protein
VLPSSLQIEFVRVVDEEVQDGVGEARVSDPFMPFEDPQLRGDNGRGESVATLEYFEQATGLSFFQATETTGRRGARHALVIALPPGEPSASASTLTDWPRSNAPFLQRLLLDGGASGLVFLLAALGMFRTSGLRLRRGPNAD